MNHIYPMNFLILLERVSFILRLLNPFMKIFFTCGVIHNYRDKI